VSRDRRSPSLAWPPDDPSWLKGFPARRLSPEITLLRIVRAEAGPWWFGSTLAGRFDLAEPDGTCYLAADAIAALLELLVMDREIFPVPAEFFDERRICELQVSSEMTLSDLTSRRASGYGITAEVGSITPYDRPQAWAARLHQAGFEGLVYWLRHDPSRSEGFALFGAHGERKHWKRGRERRISKDLIDRLQEECGIEVLSIPNRNELRFVEE
jgi:RES domain